MGCGCLGTVSSPTLIRPRRVRNHRILSRLSMYMTRPRPRQMICVAHRSLDNHSCNVHTHLSTHRSLDIHSCNIHTHLSTHRSLDNHSCNVHTYLSTHSCTSTGTDKTCNLSPIAKVFYSKIHHSYFHFIPNP